MTTASRFFEAVFTYNFANIVGLKVVPNTIRSDCEESITWLDLIDQYFRLRSDSNMVSNEVTKGSRDGQTWVHASSDINLGLLVEV